eukprot:CAMPEP_0204573840 /NCGR_PEP_ID=MMETSP0661-20131031/40252_1 /ASSEMBLY_ACC=CAM_ASM_000606 /TAXON_ID=109239 /ORGANISM="Alexandrium margalefi, Strain AMGDE01CS-322" /LENGTH=112 /DNA_ID=CAMNT_0051582313 /DNA_START=212 /DNA_END=551 /DNA_ORIENTATION=-
MPLWQLADSRGRAAGAAPRSPRTPHNRYAFAVEGKSSWARAGGDDALVLDMKAIDLLVELAVLCEILRHVPPTHHEVVRKWSYDTEDARKKALHGVVLKENVSSPQLRNDAT